MRGLYVDIWHEGLRNEKELNAMLTYAKKMQFTDLFIQCGREDKYILGKRPEIDYLDYIIKNKEHLKIHAWVNGTLIGRLKYKNNMISKMSKLWDDTYYPEDWLMIDEKDIEPKVYLDPTNPEVQDYIVNKCFDLINSYELDGLHLDRIRYTNTELGLGTSEDKCCALSNIVQRISKEVKSKNSPLVFSILISPNHNVKTDYCDYSSWLDNGIIDAIAAYVDPKHTNLDTTIEKFSEVKSIDIEEVSKTKIISEEIKDLKSNVWIIITGTSKIKEMSEENFIVFSYHSIKRAIIYG